MLKIDKNEIRWTVRTLDQNYPVLETIAKFGLLDTELLTEIPHDTQDRKTFVLQLNRDNVNVLKEIKQSRTNPFADNGIRNDLFFITITILQTFAEVSWVSTFRHHGVSEVIIDDEQRWDMIYEEVAEIERLICEDWPRCKERIVFSHPICDGVSSPYLAVAKMATAGGPKTAVHGINSFGQRTNALYHENDDTEAILDDLIKRHCDYVAPTIVGRVALNISTGQQSLSSGPFLIIYKLVKDEKTGICSLVYTSNKQPQIFSTDVL